MVSRIQAGNSLFETQGLGGLSPDDIAQLIMWGQGGGNPNLAQLANQLGIDADSFNGGANQFDSQMASEARNLDAYSPGPGLDAVNDAGGLQIGHQGQGVAQLQMLLNALGANLEVDGKFGPKTEAALKSFQGSRGLNDSGVLNRATLDNLRQSGAPLSNEAWNRSTPDYTSNKATAAADKARVLDRNARPVDVSNVSATGGVKGLLDQIANGEGTSDAKAQAHGFKSGYDVTLGYGAYTPASMKGKALTDMTLGEVKQLQKGMLANPKNGLNSSAVGKYQIVGTTLRGLQKEMGIPDSAKFSPELQDKMGAKLLDQRGLTKFQEGKISASKFQSNLAHEWASVASPTTGKSVYGQATGTSTSTIQGAISKVNEPSSTADAKAKADATTKADAATKSDTASKSDKSKSDAAGGKTDGAGKSDSGGKGGSGGSGGGGPR